jgi:hypothetical protein
MSPQGQNCGMGGIGLIDVCFRASLFSSRNVTFAWGKGDGDNTNDTSWTGNNVKSLDLSGGAKNVGQRRR